MKEMIQQIYDNVPVMDIKVLSTQYEFDIFKKTLLKYMKDDKNNK